MERGQSSEPDSDLALTPEEFRHVIGHFASGVTIITSELDDELFGTTASAVSSLALTPPMVLISMNVESRTGEVIAETKRFGLNILSDSQADLAVRFAQKGGNKFEGLDVREGPRGLPLLADALASLECSVTDQVRAATHIVFLARVDSAAAAAGAPLAYFRGEFGRLQLARDNQVLEELRRRILNRELPSERSLSVEEIAERFDLPPDAVHYALLHLSFDGLIAAEPQGRFLMRPLTIELIEDALMARRLIELGTVAAINDSASAEQLAALRELAERTDPGLHGGQVESWVKAYADFHEGLVGLAGSASAVESFHRLNTPPMVLSLATERASGRPGRESASRAYADHLELVAALERKEANRAFAVIDKHYQDSAAFIRPNG